MNPNAPEYKPIGLGITMGEEEEERQQQQQQQDDTPDVSNNENATADLDDVQGEDVPASNSVPVRDGGEQAVENEQQEVRIHYSHIDPVDMPSDAPTSGFDSDSDDEEQQPDNNEEHPGDDEEQSDDDDSDADSDDFVLTVDKKFPEYTADKYRALEGELPRKQSAASIDHDKNARYLRGVDEIYTGSKARSAQDTGYEPQSSDAPLSDEELYQDLDDGDYEDVIGPRPEERIWQPPQGQGQNDGEQSAASIANGSLEVLDGVDENYADELVPHPAQTPEETAVDRPRTPENARNEEGGPAFSPRTRRRLQYEHQRGYEYYSRPRGVRGIWNIEDGGHYRNHNVDPELQRRQWPSRAVENNAPETPSLLNPTSRGEVLFRRSRANSSTSGSSPPNEEVSQGGDTPVSPLMEQSTEQNAEEEAPVSPLSDDSIPAEAVTYDPDQILRPNKDIKWGDDDDDEAFREELRQKSISSESRRSSVDSVDLPKVTPLDIPPQSIPRPGTPEPQQVVYRFEFAENTAGRMPLPSTTEGDEMQRVPISHLETEFPNSTSPTIRLPSTGGNTTAAEQGLGGSMWADSHFEAPTQPETPADTRRFDLWGYPIEDRPLATQTSDESPDASMASSTPEPEQAAPLLDPEQVETAAQTPLPSTNTGDDLQSLPVSPLEAEFPESPSPTVRLPSQGRETSANPSRNGTQYTILGYRTEDRPRATRLPDLGPQATSATRAQSAIRLPRIPAVIRLPSGQADEATQTEGVTPTDTPPETTTPLSYTNSGNQTDPTPQPPYNSQGMQTDLEFEFGSPTTPDLEAATGMSPTTGLTLANQYRDPQNPLHRLRLLRTSSQFSLEQKMLYLATQGQFTSLVRMPESQEERSEYARLMAHYYRYSRDQAWKRYDGLWEEARDRYDGLRRETRDEVNYWRHELQQSDQRANALQRERDELDRKLDSKCITCVMKKGLGDIEDAAGTVETEDVPPAVVESHRCEEGCGRWVELEKQKADLDAKIGELEGERNELKRKVKELGNSAREWKKHSDAMKKWGEENAAAAERERTRQEKTEDEVPAPTSAPSEGTSIRNIGTDVQTDLPPRPGNPSPDSDESDSDSSSSSWSEPGPPPPRTPLGHRRPTPLRWHIDLPQEGEEESWWLECTIERIVWWVNENHQGLEESPIIEQHVRDILYRDELTFDDLVTGLQDAGAVFRPDHLAVRLQEHYEDPNFNRHETAPRHTPAAIEFAVRRLGDNPSAAQELMEELVQLRDREEDQRHSSVRDLTSRLNNTITENGDLARRLIEASTANDEILEDVERGRAEAPSDEELQALRMEIDELKQRLEDSHNAADGDGTDLSQKLAECHEHGKKLGEERDELEEKLKSLQTKLAVLEQEFAKFRADHDDYKVYMDNAVETKDEHILQLQEQLGEAAASETAESEAAASEAGTSSTIDEWFSPASQKATLAPPNSFAPPSPTPRTASLGTFEDPNRGRPAGWEVRDANWAGTDAYRDSMAESMIKRADEQRERDTYEALRLRAYRALTGNRQFPEIMKDNRRKIFEDIAAYRTPVMAGTA